MKGYIKEKATGRYVFFGHVENKEIHKDTENYECITDNTLFDKCCKEMKEQQEKQQEDYTKERLKYQFTDEEILYLKRLFINRKV